MKKSRLVKLSKSPNTSGQMINIPKVGLTFVHGEVQIVGKPGHQQQQQALFVPGFHATDAAAAENRFKPGLVSVTSQGLEFVEGKLFKAGSEAIFVPCKVKGIDERIEKASNESDVET